MRGRVSGFQFGLEGEQYISFRLTEDGRKEYEELKDKPDLVIEAKPYRPKRSLDANAALWLLLGKMAEVLGTTKDELYLEMLKRYGKFTHIIVKPNAVDRFMQEYRTAVILGDVEVNGKSGVQIQCYYGSSTLDSKEFSVLLDGVISEADEIGIKLISAEERDRVISEWGG